jgi:1,5-anhydro-D-fructose reductase (1,5-anhydro-D-mannitol-forming)
MEKQFISGKVNWGIIGAGNVCERKSGPAFNKVKDSQLLAVMRRNIDKAKDYAARHGVSIYYDNADQLISDISVNAIYIATPPAFHEEYAIKAMKSGKPVYIEKPVTLNAEGCQRLIDISNQLNIPVSVAHYRRRLPLFLKVKQLINDEVIGKVTLIRISMLQSPGNSLVAKTEENWRLIPSISGGGIFHDLAPHQLDIIYWIFGSPVKMRGHSVNQGRHFNAPDFTQFEAFFEKDICLSGLWSFNISERLMEDRCEIFGNKGKISFSFFGNPEIEIQSGDGIERYVFPYPEHVQQPMINDVVSFFKGEGSNPCSLEDALQTMKMMDCTTFHFYEPDH